MANVIAFPGVTLEPNLDGANGFKPSEITLVLCAHLAWCIMDTSNPAYAQIKAGLSDEGDGFLYASYLVQRSSNWVDTSPLARFEKSSEGVRGKCYIRNKLHAEIHTEYSAIDRHPYVSSTQQLVKCRQPNYVWRVTKVLFDRHVTSAHKIASEIERYPERILTIDASLSSALKSIDYQFIHEVRKLVSEVALQNIVEIVEKKYG